MSAVEYRFLEPLDVLILRGNKLFGDPGSFGESLIPPWPSVAAGAIRSRMLADSGIDFAKFASGQQSHPELGTPKEPVGFTVAAFHLARRRDDGDEILLAPPADLVISKTGDGEPVIRALTPTDLKSFPAGLACSCPLPSLPVLAERERSKPASGYWLTQAGWAKYLKGEPPLESDLVEANALWRIDERVGVGLDTATRRAEDGHLFSLQAIAMTKRGTRIGWDLETGQPKRANYDVGFLAGISGATPPRDGLLRFGGDGRAAAIHETRFKPPEPDFDAIAASRRCRLVLTTPGIFHAEAKGDDGSTPGWLPHGAHLENGEWRFDLHGVRGRIVCAAVSRAEVVSGWDLAVNQPKPALRAAPTGSVYWLDELDATPDALRKLVEHGLWHEPCEDAARRAEGFNRVHAAPWMKATKEKVNE